MTAALRPSPSACPACAAAPLAMDQTPGSTDDQLLLSLPDIHCAACISGVERALLRMPGVHAARVNLTLKRASISASPGVEAAALATALTDAGYTAFELDHASLSAAVTDQTGRDLAMRLGVAGFAMMNVMLLSVAVWSGATDATRDMFHWISAAIAIPAIAFAAQPFFRSAWGALSNRRLNMDVPISLAILLAVGMSVYETAHSGQNAYFDAALSLTFFLLAGRYLDQRTRSVARSAAQTLAALEVPRALLVQNGRDTLTAVADLRPGDLVRVLPGTRIPVDGEIETGASEIDRSLLTGETLPIFAGPFAVISVGEINLTGPLTIRVTAAGKDSSLHRLTDLVAMAETARNRYTSLADRAARIYAPAVHLLALGAFLVWLALTGDVRLALNIAVAVLIITCPCALGLAVPAVVTAASGRLFRQGLLIKTPTALERLAEIDTVVFDKTGTLTAGAPQPVDLSTHPRPDLEIALALAQGSAHPLSVALTQALTMAGLHPAKLTANTEHPGFGVEGTFNGQTVRLGRASWTGATPEPQTATYLQIGDATPRALRFTDHLRDGAAQAVTDLQKQGLTVILLSGDSPAAVADIAARTGIDSHQAEMLPQDKVARIMALTNQGHRVLMVGDGLNDTAALATAHASISPGTALEATRMVSDIVLLGNSLAPLGDTLRTARSATARIRENFAIAATYNAIAIPVALLGFATPLAAALAMSASSITVSLNALRLR